MSAQARSIDLKSIARAWEKLQASSGVGPIRNEDEYEQRAALLSALIDTLRDDEAMKRTFWPASWIARQTKVRRALSCSIL